jgi:hypothetical protein
MDKDFPLRQCCVQTGSEAHSSSYPTGTGGLFHLSESHAELSFPSRHKDNIGGGRCFICTSLYAVMAWCFGTGVSSPFTCRRGNRSLGHSGLMGPGTKHVWVPFCSEHKRTLCAVLLRFRVTCKAATSEGVVCCATLAPITRLTAHSNDNRMWSVRFYSNVTYMKSLTQCLFILLL